MFDIPVLLVNTYLAINVIYLLILALFSLKKIRKPKAKTVNYDRHFFILLPAYKEDSVILETVSRLNYNPYKNKTICVIGDSLKNETIEKLLKKEIKYFNFISEKPTKVKSLNFGLEKLPLKKDDYIVLLDADNHVSIDFFYCLNRYIDSGFDIIQGHRTAKNLDNDYNILDAFSEEANNSLFRKAFNNLGIPASFIGSGMIFPALLFQRILSNSKAVGGFDKELDIEIIKDKLYVKYADDLLIYDEKISELKTFYKQRRRWVSCQFHYLKNGSIELIKQSFKEKNIHGLFKFIQLAQLPRLIIIALLSFLTCIGFYNDNSLKYFYSALLFILLFSYTLIIPKRFSLKAMLHSIGKIPAIVVAFLGVFFTLKNANKRFIHTPHSK